MKKNRGMKIVAFSLVMFLALTGIASAIGVSMPYWRGHPLKMYPGESTTINLVLQNENENQLEFTAEVVSDGNGIAKIGSLSYVVPGKSYDFQVPVQITVPADFQYGGEHNIQVRFSPIVNGGAMFNAAFSAVFPVEVVEVEESTFYVAPPKKEMGNTLWYVIAILVVIIVVLSSKIFKKKSK